MRSVGGFCLAALCLVAISHAKVETEDGVLVITKDNFDSVIQDNDYVLLEFCKYIPLESSRSARPLPLRMCVSVAFAAELHPLACTFCTRPVAFGG